MKKLIISAFAVAAGIAANAATIDWSQQSGVYQPEDYSPAASMSAYLFDAGTFSQQDLLTAFRGGDSFASYVVNETTTSAGEAGVGGMIDVKGGAANTAKTANFTGFYAIVDSAKNSIFIGSTATAVYDSGAEAFTMSTGAIADSDMMASIDPRKDTATFGGAGWYNASAVPEPTSGLLLLLGVAGLALRRRRA